MSQTSWLSVGVTDDREGCLFTATVNRKPTEKVELVRGISKTSGKIVGFMKENIFITIPELAEKIGSQKGLWSGISRSFRAVGSSAVLAQPKVDIGRLWNDG